MKFDVVIDVGANVGQFAVVAASYNPRAASYSFEPISGCFTRLAGLKASYPNLTAFNYGLRSETAETEINLSGSLGSSSLLPITDTQAKAYPGTAKVGVESISVRRLDDLFSSFEASGRTLLKIDTQGYELEVLKGAVETLKMVAWFTWRRALSRCTEANPSPPILSLG